MVAVAIFVVGVIFGVVANDAELSLAQAMFLSLFAFTGASQFALVGLYSPQAAVGAVLAAVVLSARNALYGTLVVDYLPRPLVRRLLATQVVIDETTAVALSEPDETLRPKAFVFSGLIFATCWNAGTLIGFLGASGLNNTRALGFDAAFPASFLALVAPALRRRSAVVSGVVGAAVAVFLVPVLLPGLPVLAGALVGTLAGIGYQRRFSGAPQTEASKSGQA